MNNKLPDLKNYYPETLFKELQDFGLQKREPAKNLVEDIETYLGIKINKDTALWLDFFGNHIMKNDYAGANYSLGEGFFGAIDFANSERWELSPLYYSPDNFPIEKIYRKSILSLTSYFTNTFYLGCDGTGQGYFVELSDKNSEVYLDDPAVDFCFLTDSISSFFYLNRIDIQKQSIYEKLDIDGGDIEMGDYNAEDFAEVTKGVKKMAVHINLENHSDYSEELIWISDSIPNTSPKGRAVELYDRAKWIIWLLDDSCIEWRIVVATKNKFPKDKKNELTQADKIYWLWHLFLFDDPQFKDFLAECKDDEVFIVNKTAALLEELTNNENITEDLKFFLLQKEKVSKIKNKEITDVEGYEHLKNNPEFMKLIKERGFIIKKEAEAEERPVADDMYNNYFKAYFNDKITQNDNKPRGKPGAEPIESVVDAIHGLWHYFFLKEDEKLEALLKRCVKHDKEQVRNTVYFIEKLLHDSDSYAEFNYLRIQRDLIENPKLPPIFDKKFDKSFLDSNKDDDENISNQKMKVKEDIKNYINWDMLAYGYSQIDDLEKMLFCTERSLAIEPDFYYSWQQRGIAYHIMKKFKEALYFYDRALCFACFECDNDLNDRLFINKAHTYMEMGDEQKAIDHLKMIENVKKKIDMADFEKLKDNPEFQKLMK